MDKITCPFAATMVGLFFLVVGGGLAWFGVRRISNMRAKEILTLTNDTNTQNRWIKPTKSSTFKVYIFNVTNPNEIKNGSKPNLRPIGPYIFEETLMKINLHGIGESSLSYRLSSSLDFDEEDSEPWMDTDRITVINVPLANALAGDYGANTQYAPSDLSNLFINTTVKKILFDGIPVNCSDEEESVFLPCSNLELHNPKLIRREGDEFRFSFFHNKKQVASETYTVDTGRKNVKNAGKITAINNKPMLDIWRGDDCNRINGSDGSQFPKMLNQKYKVYLYDRDICRSIYIEFDEVVNEDGFNLFKYVIKKDLFMAGNDNAENKCFCRSSSVELLESNKEEGSQSSVCFDTGLLSLFPCTDEKYMEYSGLRPNKHDHETFFEIEPTLGITTSSCKRLQINVEIPQVKGKNIMGVKSAEVFPVLWFEERTYLSEEYYTVLRNRLFEKVVVEYGTWVLLGLGFFLVLVPYPVQFVLHGLCRGLESPSFPAQNRSKISLEYEPEPDKIVRLWEPQRRTKFDKTVDRMLSEEVKRNPLKIDNFM
ncbi:hypothetical protein RUM43_013943 [Polyplax serrata]|uniref:Sensory neuron membrane protein 2 n=1 Tax=Polyplax serrata TaxID=468196 RepID=A0AAN8S6U3_POLSC